MPVKRLADLVYMFRFLVSPSITSMIAPYTIPYAILFEQSRLQLISLSHVEIPSIPLNKPYDSQL